MNVMRIGNQDNRTNFNGTIFIKIKDLRDSVHVEKKFDHEITSLISQIPDDMVKGVSTGKGKEQIYLQDGSAIGFCHEQTQSGDKMSLSYRTPDDADFSLKWLDVFGPFAKPDYANFDLALNRLKAIYQKFSGS